MKEAVELTSMVSIEKFITDHQLSFIYIKTSMHSLSRCSASA